MNSLKFEVVSFRKNRQQTCRIVEMKHRGWFKLEKTMHLKFELIFLSSWFCPPCLKGLILSARYCCFPLGLVSQDLYVSMKNPILLPSKVFSRRPPPSLGCILGRLKSVFGRFWQIRQIYPLFLILEGFANSAKGVCLFVCLCWLSGTGSIGLHVTWWIF